MRSNWTEFKAIIDEHNIKALYHVTDKANLESIIENDGLYSWSDCNDRCIDILKPGGDDLSRFFDTKLEIHNFVHLSFTKNLPIVSVAKDEGRISDPIVLMIDPAIIYNSVCRFSDMRATKNGAQVGDTLEYFKKIHFSSALAHNPQELEEKERPYFQAEVHVKKYIPLKYIINIDPIAHCISEELRIQTEATDYDIRNGIKEESGAIYSHDGTRLLEGPRNVSSYIIKTGTKVIADKAFSNCKELRDIIIPNTVTHIGNESFYGCESLVSVSLPHGLEVLGNYVFRYSGLKTIILPESLKIIGYNPFNRCNYLEDIKCFSSDFVVSDNSLYSRDMKRLICHYGTKTSLILPSELTNIDNRAFDQCESLELISLPMSLTRIGSGAFQECKSLQSITLPPNLTSIRDSAFYGCSSLKTISIPKGVTQICNYVFYKCSSLINIELPKGISSIGRYAFYGCSSLISIDLPSGTTTICEDAFNFCFSLKFISIPSSINRIDSRAFYCCSSLQFISIPWGVTKINEQTFNGCNSLESVSLHRGLKQICEGAFRCCYSLRHISIPKSVTYIGDHAFDSCESLEIITLPHSLEYVGNGFLDSTHALFSIGVPCKTIDKYYGLIDDVRLSNLLFEMPLDFYDIDEGDY